MNPSTVVSTQPRVVEHPPRKGCVPSPLLFWRIVFTQQLFMIQISNNFGGPRLAWITVTTGEEIEYRIPESYLTSLTNMGFVERLIGREVVERRAVPEVFKSYSAARDHALKTMNLPADNEWHPDIPNTLIPWWKRLFRRRRV